MGKGIEIVDTYTRISTSFFTPRTPRSRISIRGILLAATVCFSLGFVSGCGPAGAAWLYTLELYPAQKIPAEFQLPKGSYLVLLDDDKDLINPSTARDVLVDEMAKRLKEHEISDKVTTNEELAKLRQAEPRFSERGARELGGLAHADTVLWLKTIRFDLNSDLEMLVSPGKWAVMVLVLNAKETEKEKVRLWPHEQDGKLVEIIVNAHDLRKCKSLKEAHELMASKLADEVAKLFYEQKIK
jgi:hypothetical protein